MIATIRGRNRMNTDGECRCRKGSRPRAIERNNLAVTQVMLAILLWQLATLVRTNAATVRLIIASILLAVAACALIAWRFLFPLPLLFSLIQIASLAAAFSLARKFTQLGRSART